MTIYTFSRAIVRTPARSVVDGLRARDGGEAPVFEEVEREHRAYVAALGEAGVNVETLPPLDDRPDSIFVEDPALVFTEAAILLRTSAPTRAGETDELAPVLRSRFQRVLELNEGYADGGDVMATPMGVFIGLSGRTDRTGAGALSRLLAEVGREGRVVTTPDGVLHLKSASSLLDEDTVLATRALGASGVFDGLRVLTVPEGDEGAANALRINRRLFIADGFPRTAEMLSSHRYDVVPLPVREIAKIDAGLSCMSLRWFAEDAPVTLEEGA